MMVSVKQGHAEDKDDFDIYIVVMMSALCDSISLRDVNET